MSFVSFLLFVCFLNHFSRFLCLSSTFLFLTFFLSHSFFYFNFSPFLLFLFLFIFIYSIPKPVDSIVIAINRYFCNSAFDL